ncbi:unnamed protein product [Cercospora beticola]|nr:unnamed protein product [Cercospora beticola]
MCPQTTPPMNEVKSAGSHTTTTEEDTAALRDHLENVPQELYDMIYDMTFTAEPEVRVIYPENVRPVGDQDPTGKLKPGRSIHVSRNQAFSHLLHVDRRTRARYAQSHFGQWSLMIVFGIVMLDRLVKAMDKRHVLWMRLYLRDESGGYDGEYQDLITRHESSFDCVRPYVRCRGLEEILKRDFDGQ